MTRGKSKQRPKANSVTPRLGDWVRIRLHPDVHGQVIELRGPLGVGGAQVYRLLLDREPDDTFVEVPEDELEVIRPAPELGTA